MMNTITSKNNVTQYACVVMVTHMSHRAASSVVNWLLVDGTVELPGGSQRCKLFRQSLYCPCHDLVLHFLYLSGVHGSECLRLDL